MNGNWWLFLIILIWLKEDVLAKFSRHNIIFRVARRGERVGTLTYQNKKYFKSDTKFPYISSAILLISWRKGKNEKYRWHWTYFWQERSMSLSHCTYEHMYLFKALDLTKFNDWVCCQCTLFTYMEKKMFHTNCFSSLTLKLSSVEGNILEAWAICFRI